MGPPLSSKSMWLKGEDRPIYTSSVLQVHDPGTILDPSSLFLKPHVADPKLHDLSHPNHSELTKFKLLPWLAWTTRITLLVAWLNSQTFLLLGLSPPGENTNCWAQDIKPFPAWIQNLSRIISTNSSPIQPAPTQQTCYYLFNLYPFGSDHPTGG